MFRAPAEIGLRLRAAQPLVERIAPRPFAEFGRYRCCGDDLQTLMLCTKATDEGPRDTTDGEPIDRRADIARSRRSALERQCIKLREVFAMY